MSHVFVLSADRQPLDPCHPARARELLTGGRAAVFRRYPFTILLKDRAAADASVHEHRVKIDPGAKTTGLAIVQDHTDRVVWAAEVAHRGAVIRQRMQQRAIVRRSRRQRKTRYRPARFLNRRRRDGWLPPSLESRVANIETWVRRLRRWVPITAISVETVKFDTQAMQDPEISGVEYQQGELVGYEVREYLLEKWDRQCAYCDATNVPLEVEHIVPRSRGGSHRVSNLTLACRSCNQRKGNQTAGEFGFPKVQAQARLPLRDTAAVNATRWALYRRLATTGLPIEVGTGGRTKFNRTRLGLPKTHWLDAACVGASTPDVLQTQDVKPLLIRAMGHGSRQMCATDTYGFPKQHRQRIKRFLGWETGDMARAVIPRGKYAGVHTGRITIRSQPSFQIGRINVHPKYLTVVQHADGYTYTA